MKSKARILLSIAIFLLLLIAPAHADIMTPGMKSINKCVKIVNLNEFPDIVLVGYITGPVIQIENPYVIQSSECLTQFYKANKLTIYAIDKEYFDRVGIENVDFESEQYVRDYEMETDPDSRIISLANPLTKEEIHYSIVGFTDNELVLYESKRITSYITGIDKVEIFEEPEIPNIKLKINYSLEENDETVVNMSEKTEMKTTGKSLVDTLILFFNRIFGNGY